MIPSGPAVSLPHLGGPALLPPSPAAVSSPTLPACRFLPPITSAPFPSQRAAEAGQPSQHTHSRAQGRNKDPRKPPTIAGQGETLLGGRKQPFAGVTLTDSFIAMKNLPWPVEPLCAGSRSVELLSPSTLRLDRENICAIGRLQSLQEIHSLYLQQVRPYGRCRQQRSGLVPRLSPPRGDCKHPQLCSRVLTCYMARGSGSTPL
ncbi:uncharacterized protein LOC119158964 [Falco rusticolus]|uniref:uncharacterized protein LOC119158964 n=1 Tax=Falco rusticolus TaxID=120794 RepID=UPI00188656DF|nr:uncharacterized protein LOC119158964 [Falco rusticolus]